MEKPGRLSNPLIDAPAGDLDSSLEKSSFARTTINITKCFIGAASFSLPWAFMQAGLVGSLVGLIGLALFSSFGLRRLAVTGRLVADQRGAGLKALAPPTYPEVGFAACGLWGKSAAWFGIIFMTVGTCGTYFVFISSAMSSVTPLSQNVWLFGITLPVTIAFSLMRSVKYLAPTSALGILALFFALIVTMIDAAKYGHPIVPGLRDMPSFRIDTFPLFLGNAGFLYLIATAILPIEQNMERPADFSPAFNVSTVFVTVLNLVFGFVAFAAYGDCGGARDDEDCTKGNVIDNLKGGTLTTLVKIALSIDLLFTGVVFLFPMNEALEAELGLTRGHGNERTRFALRAAVACAVAVVAYSVPFFDLLSGLSGGFGNNILGFILPPIFYWQLRSKDKYWNRTGARLLEEVALAITFVVGVVFLFLTLIFFGREVARRQH